MPRAALPALAVLALLAVAGCVTTGTQRVETLPANRRVAVVSGLGNSLTAVYLGTTQFEDEGYSLAVDWRLDDLARAAVEDRLRKSGRFAVAPCDLGRPGLKMPSGGSGGLFSRAEPFVLGLARANCEADLFLVVYPIEAPLHFGEYYGEHVRGYGLRQKSFLGLKRTVAFAALGVALYERGGGPLGSTDAVRAADASDAWFPAPGGFAGDAEPQVRALVVQLLLDDLARAMRELNLTGASA